MRCVRLVWRCLCPQSGHTGNRRTGPSGARIARRCSRADSHIGPGHKCRCGRTRCTDTCRRRSGHRRSPRCIGSEAHRPAPRTSLRSHTAHPCTCASHSARPCRWACTRTSTCTCLRPYGGGTWRRADTGCSGTCSCSFHIAHLSAKRCFMV